MKRFEAFLGNAWQAWEETPEVKIAKKGQIVTVTTTDHPTYGSYKTIFDLDLIPAYTIQ